MRYLDTGSRNASATLQAWLTEELADATFFGCQTAYFELSGLEPIEEQLKNVLGSGGSCRFVVGSNDGTISSAVLGRVLDLIEPHADQGRLTVVGAADVLMHPKTYYVENSHGQAAYVGSANLTGRGLAANIEAGIAVSSGEDGGKLLMQIKAAILAWEADGRTNAIRVTRESLPDLVGMGAADRPRPAAPAEKPDTAQRRAARFPRLGRLIARAQPSAQRQEQAAAVTSWAQLPEGISGIVKRLSHLDTKGFRGEEGTLYLSLPAELAPLLPMQPFGRNQEPRADVQIIARWDLDLSYVISSGVSPSNITHVGAGASRRSHRDLRFNYLKAIAKGVESQAATLGVRPPRDNDLVCIEFGGSFQVRLTFVRGSELNSQLLPVLGSSAWAWLPAGIVPGWEAPRPGS